MELSDINLIYSKYPWASESTLESLIQSTGAKNARLLQLAKNLGIKIDQIDIGDNKKAQEQFSASMKASGSIVDAVTKKSDPIDSALKIFATATDYSAEVAQTASGTVAGIVSMALPQTRWLQAIPVALRGIGILGAASTKLAVPVATYFSQVMKQQQAETEELVSYGMHVNDVKLYSQFRRSAAMMGLSIGEVIEQLKPNMVSFANLTDNAISSTRALTGFLAGDKMMPEYRKLGYNIADYSTLMFSQAATMYKLQEIDNLDPDSVAKIHRVTARMVRLSGKLANQFGLNRKQLMLEMQEAQKDIDWRTAMHAVRGNDDMNDPEMLERRQLIHGSIIPQLFSKWQDPTFALKMSKVYAKGTHDFAAGVSTTVINIFDKDTRSILQRTGMLEPITAFMDEMIRNPLDETEAKQKLHEMFNNIANNLSDAQLQELARVGLYDAQFAEMSTFSGNAKAYSSLYNISDDSDSYIDENQELMSYNAASILSATDFVRQSMRQLHDLATPKFEQSHELIRLAKNYMNEAKVELESMAGKYLKFMEEMGVTGLTLGAVDYEYASLAKFFNTVQDYNKNNSIATDRESQQVMDVLADTETTSKRRYEKLIGWLEDQFLRMKGAKTIVSDYPSIMPWALAAFGEDGTLAKWPWLIEQMNIRDGSVKSVVPPEMIDELKAVVQEHFLNLDHDVFESDIEKIKNDQMNEKLKEEELIVVQQSIDMIKETNKNMKYINDKWGLVYG
jgi:nitrogen regulatory protein PII-like uncharacterized protein